MLCVARDEGRTEPRHVSEDVLENEVTGPTGCSSEVPAQTPGFSQGSPKCLPQHRAQGDAFDRVSPTGQGRLRRPPCAGLASPVLTENPALSHKSFSDT